MRLSILGYLIMAKEQDAAIITITVLGRALLRGFASMVVNDGRRRLFSKEKVYQILVDHVPRLASSFMTLLERDASFILIVQDGIIEELKQDEATKMKEIIEKAREEFRAGSSNVLREALRLRWERNPTFAAHHDRLEGFLQHDEVISGMSRTNGYDPTERMRDPNVIRRRDRFKI